MKERGGGCVFRVPFHYPTTRLRRATIVVPRPLNTRRDFHNLGRRLAPPYNIIIYAREGSLIRAPRVAKWPTTLMPP